MMGLVSRETSKSNACQTGRIVLHAGELIFGRGRKRLCTLLGSCVAITLWHPSRQLGGMCHFALPRRSGDVSMRLDARYGEDCVELYRREARSRGTELHEYQARIFGGGNMLTGFQIEPDCEYAEVDYSPVGDSNAALAFSLLLSEGVSILEADVGEQGYRKLEFDPQTGNACVEFFPARSPSAQLRTISG